MNANNLKQFIYENGKIEEILAELGCGHIKSHSSGYYTASNPDGDNPTAITVYVPSLNVIDYTRSLKEPSDLITLVEFFKDINFFHALKWLHSFLGLDYYAEAEPDLPRSIKYTRSMLFPLKNGTDGEDDFTPIKPIDENILSYYHPYVNDFFKCDNIGYTIQREFEIGYDDQTNRITIPIRDETGTLCGVKGRLFKRELEENDLKYLYLEPCPRAKILYGLYKTYDAIKLKNKVFVGESEKFVMQLWSYGYKNAVAIGGLANRKIARVQVEKLTRLNTDIVLCLDKDIRQSELEYIANQFVYGVSVHALIDENGILDTKESPSDDPNKWEQLVTNSLIKLK